MYNVLPTADIVPHQTINTDYLVIFECLLLNLLITLTMAQRLTPAERYECPNSQLFLTGTKRRGFYVIDPTSINRSLPPIQSM